MERFTICVIITKGKTDTTLILRESNIDWEFNVTLLIADFMASKNNESDPFDMFKPYGFESVYYADKETAMRIAKQCKPLLGQPFNAAYVNFEEIKNRYKLLLPYKIYLAGHGAVPESEFDEMSVNNWHVLHDNDFQAVYTCHSISDVVAAIFHFYIIAGYKITSCRHCEREFATTSLKNLFCDRNSAYKNEFSQKAEATKDKSCGQTVHDTRQYIRNMKNMLDNRIRHSPRHTGITSRKKVNEPDISVYFDFIEKCKEYDTKIRHAPIPQNFNEYIAFLKQKEKDKEWLRT